MMPGISSAVGTLSTTSTISGNPHCTLVLGGARSGKSRYAEQSLQRAAQTGQTGGRQLVYLATAQCGDAEMQARIDHHRQQRGPDWLLHEEPLALAQALQQHNQPHKLILVDCLTLWLSNLLLCDGAPASDAMPEHALAPWPLPARYLQERAALLQQLPQMQADVMLVSNEVGMGVVPPYPLARCFVDEAGRLHQALAAQCAQVVWVVAGLPQYLKGNPS